MRIFRRTPDVTVTVEAGKSVTAEEAMGKMAVFTTLAMRHKVDIVSTERAMMTLKGRPKRMAAFAAEYSRLAALGAV